MGQGIKIIVFVVDFYNYVVQLCQLRKLVSKPQRVKFLSEVVHHILALHQFYLSRNVRRMPENKERRPSESRLFLWGKDYFHSGISPHFGAFVVCYTFNMKFQNIRVLSKVIDTKYSKHWPHTVAHTIECVCSKINNSWFNPWFSFYLSSLYPAPYIEW